MTQYQFELNDLPCQSFTTTINNVDMEVILKTAGTPENPIMLFALLTGDEYICPFVPVFANQGILPYPYMISEAGGNFFFLTEGDEYPDWQKFNTTQSFYFMTEDELNG